VGRVEFAEAALRDLELILDHLAESYRGFGEAPEDAVERAAARVRGIVAAADRRALGPCRGAVHDDLTPGIRHATLDRAVYYFQVQDGDAGAVRILALFFGGPDHERRMRLGLLRPD
jgi:plasmid stabilization system protein ParE